MIAIVFVFQAAETVEEEEVDKRSRNKVDLIISKLHIFVLIKRVNHFPLSYFELIFYFIAIHFSQKY